MVWGRLETGNFLNNLTFTENKPVINCWMFTLLEKGSERDQWHLRGLNDGYKRISSFRLGVEVAGSNPSITGPIPHSADLCWPCSPNPSKWSTLVFSLIKGSKNERPRIPFEKKQATIWVTDTLGNRQSNSRDDSGPECACIWCDQVTSCRHHRHLVRKE